MATTENPDTNKTLNETWKLAKEANAVFDAMRFMHNAGEEPSCSLADMVEERLRQIEMNLMDLSSPFPF